MCHTCENTVSSCLEEEGISIKINFSSRQCEMQIPASCSLSDKKIIDKLYFNSFKKKSNFSHLCYKVLASMLVGLSLVLFPTFLPLLLLSIGLSFYLAKETCLSPSQFFIRSFSADHLFTASTLTILTISIIGLCFPVIQITLLFNMTLFMFASKNFSKALQYYIKNKFASEEEIMDRVPSDYEVKTKKGKDVLLKNLAQQDQFLLSQGALIPVDATCTHDCLVINTLNDGKITEPKTIPAGGLLTQGMRLDLSTQTDNIVFTVKNKYENSHLFKINSVLENTSTPTEDTKFNAIFKHILYIVVFFAIITAILSHCYFLLPWQMTLNSVKVPLKSNKISVGS